MAVLLRITGIQVLARGDYVRGRKMLALICLSIERAICAYYELVECDAALGATFRATSRDAPRVVPKTAQRSIV